MSVAPIVHPTAVIHPSAEIGEGVEVGAYCVIGGNVKIGSATSVGHHTIIDGQTVIGEKNSIFHFASIGSPPQDIKYKGEKTSVEIGDGNTIREYVTINRGTPSGPGVTRIGNGCFVMIGCHIAHDCTLGNGVIMANLVGLAGHVSVEEGAFFGGMAGIHQHVRIGSAAMIAGAAMVARDVPPFTLAAGNRAKLHGLNVIGLRRRNTPVEVIAELKRIYRMIFRSELPRTEALEKAGKRAKSFPEVQHFLSFMKESTRGFCPSSSEEEEWEE